MVLLLTGNEVKFGSTIFIWMIMYLSAYSPHAVFQQYSLHLMQRWLLWLLRIEHLCPHLTARLNSLTLQVHENVLVGPLLKCKENSRHGETWSLRVKFMGHYSKLFSLWVTLKAIRLTLENTLTVGIYPWKLGSAQTTAPVTDVKINGLYFLVQFQMPTNFLLQWFLELMSSFIFSSH